MEISRKCGLVLFRSRCSDAGMSSFCLNDGGHVHTGLGLNIAGRFVLCSFGLRWRNYGDPPDERESRCWMSFH